jgi:Na+-translocating ferredoxin:NAD+ oxidoreductase subunit D
MSLYLSTAPHVRSPQNTRSLMGDVLIALAPTTIAGIYYYGWNAALIVALSTLSAVLFEYLWQKLTHKTIRIGDLSAAVTGLLIGLNLPPTAPWWLPIIGSGLAIILVKQLFGGIGDNFVNPALAARGILLASWPVRMTTFVLPTCFSGADATTSATVLAGYEASYMDMFLGNIPGCIGEVCKAAILLGFLYMLIRKVITWRIPVTFLAVVFVFTAILGGDPVQAILCGGVMLGAVFMATDYTTSPMSAKGQFIYAAGCGIIVVIIRNFCNYPEGVTYGILVMNIVTPLLDKYVKPRLYGRLKEEKANG